MSKPTKEQDSLEIIELATSNIEELAKAFELISDVCASFQQPSLELSEDVDQVTVH